MDGGSFNTYDEHKNIFESLLNTMYYG